MKNILFGALIGLIVASLIGLYLIQEYGKNQYKQGFNTGETNFKHDLSQKIEKEFGTITDEKDNSTILFDIKTISIMIVDINGTKTIRVRP